MNNFTPAVIRILRKNGWEFLRHGDGDHDIWWNPGAPQSQRGQQDQVSAFGQWGAEAGWSAESSLGGTFPPLGEPDPAEHQRQSHRVVPAERFAEDRDA